MCCYLLPNNANRKPRGKAQPSPWVLCRAWLHRCAKCPELPEAEADTIFSELRIPCGRGLNSALSLGRSQIPGTVLGHRIPGSSEWMFRTLLNLPLAASPMGLLTLTDLPRAAAELSSQPSRLGVAERGLAGSRLQPWSWRSQSESSCPLAFGCPSVFGDRSPSRVGKTVPMCSF